MKRKIGIIGVPMDLGQDHWGVDMGPSALRVAGLKRGLRGLGCDVEDCGIAACMKEALEVANQDTAGYHVSLDMDLLDPREAPGVGTPVRGGATYREAHLALEMIADSGRMLSLEIVEANPVLDEHNRTARLGVELILSALGKDIL